ncbi:MAG: HupE/UreJ family protein, partial [Caldimonas sp.]
MSRFVNATLLALLTLLGGGLGAHELSMAEMQLRETSRGEFLWMWTASEKRAAADDLTPVWPEGCRADTNMLHCGPGGLQGTLSVEGVGKRYSAVLAKVFWLDGQSRVYTVTAGQPTVHLYGAADDRRGIGEIASAYTVLGIEHILGGIDHLLFVIGLLFLVGFNRRLMWTITAFTAAHSLTLASSALGWLALRSPPVEATIALSIMLVAGEAL